MTSLIFNLDDEVIITGKPVTLDTDEFLGKRFTIDTIGKRHGETVFSDAHLPWYPASSLRLVEEELKIGDFVEVIGPTRYFKNMNLGKIFQIKQIGTYFNTVTEEDAVYDMSALRKLTPDGIADRTAPNLELSQEMKVKIGMTFLKHLDQIGELQDRLKQHDEEIKGIYDILENHEEIHGGMDERLSTIEKRLAFVEKFQRDQSDLVGRAIRDGVAEILDFRRKA
jgi:hypothetical protein